MLLGAIENVARECGAHTLTLCSADDPRIKTIWKKLGFVELPDLGFEALGKPELVKLSNSVMMSKGVPLKPRISVLRIRHLEFEKRVEVLWTPGAKAPDPPSPRRR